MGDFAQLILTADSTGLQRGERALDSISSTAEQTERRVVKASDGMTRGLRSISSQSTYATQALRASSMQLSQIAQQTSATGNLLQSIAIQLPDLALAFGPLGILAGAAAGAALSYYSTLLDSGDDAEQTLADQADLIVRAAESWGEAVPALRAYVDELKKAKTTADLVAAMEAISKEKWSLARQEVQNLNIDLVALVGDLRAAGAEEASVIKLQAAFNKVSEAVAAGKEDTDAMRAVQDALSDALNQTGIPAVDEFKSAFERLSESIAGAMRQAGLFQNQAVQALTTGQVPLDQLTSVFSENGKIYTGDDFTPINPPTPENRPKIELEGLYWENRNTGSGSRRVERISKEQREIQSLYDSTRTAAEKYNIELTRLDELHEKFGLDSDTYTRAVQKLGEEYWNSSEAAKALADETDYYKSVTSDLLHDVRSALDDGKISWSEWADIALNALDRVLDKLQDSFIDSIFDASPSKGGGSLIGKHFNLNFRSAL